MTKYELDTLKDAEKAIAEFISNWRMTKILSWDMDHALLLARMRKVIDYNEK